MKTIGHLINSEGPLLSILQDDNETFYIKIYSPSLNCHIQALSNFKKIVGYIESKLTLSELIEGSIECSIQTRRESSLQEFSMDEIKSSIDFINNYYNEISDSMK